MTRLILAALLLHGGAAMAQAKLQSVEIVGGPGCPSTGAGCPVELRVAQSKIDCTVAGKPCEPALMPLTTGSAVPLADNPRFLAQIPDDQVEKIAKRVLELMEQRRLYLMTLPGTKP